MKKKDLHNRIITLTHQCVEMRAEIKRLSSGKAEISANALEMATQCMVDSDAVLGNALRNDIIRAIAKQVGPLLTAVKLSDREETEIVNQLGEANSQNFILQERLTKAHAEIDRLEDAPDVVNPNRKQALEIASQCWSDDECESITMNTVLAETLADRIEPLLDTIDTAWGLIANAYGGDWDNAGGEWRRAAQRFRDKYIQP